MYIYIYIYISTCTHVYSYIVLYYFNNTASEVNESGQSTKTEKKQFIVSLDMYDWTVSLDHVTWPSYHMTSLCSESRTDTISGLLPFPQELIDTVTDERLLHSFIIYSWSYKMILIPFNSKLLVYLSHFWHYYREILLLLKYNAIKPLKTFPLALLSLMFPLTLDYSLCYVLTCKSILWLSSSHISQVSCVHVSIRPQSHTTNKTITIKKFYKFLTR